MPHASNTPARTLSTPTTSRRTFLAGAAAIPVGLTLGLPTTAEAATRISRMVKGTSLKADTPVPQHKLCSANAMRVMRWFKTTGGTEVSLVVPLLQTSVRSSTIRRRDDTPTDDCLRYAIRHAHQVGLNANVKVLLELEQPVVMRTKSGGTFKSMWRGRIKPADIAAWNREWSDRIHAYAALAHSEGARTITIGTEMVGVTKGNMPFWKALVRDLHRQYPGLRIAYAANRTGETEGLSRAFVRSLDEFGVTFYPKFDIDGQLSEAALIRILKTYTRNLKATSSKYGREIHIYEWGVRSRLNTRHETSDGTPGAKSVVSLEEQQIIFSAMLRYFDSLTFVKGLHTWMSYTDPKKGVGSDNVSHDSGYGVQGKPAGKVLAKWFGGKVAG